MTSVRLFHRRVAPFLAWVARDGLGGGVRPVVFEPHRQHEWQSSGSLLLDDLRFKVCDPESGRHRIAFRTFRQAFIEIPCQIVRGARIVR
ncbi:MAG: hypothetical protein M0008_02065 [Actinomycetota bacterium]|nr:hypothetical protein [Actinomycetota bacterium]